MEIFRRLPSWVYYIFFGILIVLAFLLGTRLLSPRINLSSLTSPSFSYEDGGQEGEFSLKNETPHMPVVNPANHDQGILETTTITGTVKSNPKTENGAYIVDVAFKDDKNADRKTTLVLGSADSRFSVHTTESGMITSNKEWTMTRTEEAVAKISRNEPVVVELYTDNNTQSYINNPQCDRSCKDRVLLIESFVPANNQLINSLSDEEDIVPDRIGAVASMIIYE